MLISFIRTIFLYIIIVFSLRIMGKRQIGDLQPSELVVTILVSNIASLPIEDPSIPMLAGVVPILTLMAFEVILSTITIKNKRIRTLVSGNPIILIRDGKLDQQMLKNIRFSIDDLMSELRLQNIFSIEDVNFAIIETTGKLSVYKKFSEQSLTPSMIGLASKDSGPMHIIISDGLIIDRALKEINKTITWLDNLLASKSKCSKDIFLMLCDRSGSFTLIDKE